VAIEATATRARPCSRSCPRSGRAPTLSILLTGTAGALQALVFGDNNLPPVPNRARVRFVNGTTDVSALDVYVNFSKAFSALAMEFRLDRPRVQRGRGTVGTSYEFDFNVAGTLQPSLKLPGSYSSAARPYTIYVSGPQAALSGIVTGDN
jgi:hypothetical protein